MTQATLTSDRDIPIDWEGLEDAFENNAPEVHSYLHLLTGEVLRVLDGIADPDTHARISGSSTYLTIQPVSSCEQYRWMERFIPMVDDAELRGDLVHAIDGKGAFRRFKDVLMDVAETRERWFAFRSERLRVFMEAWLAAHGLNPVAREERPAVLREVTTADEPAITQAELSGRDSRRSRDELGQELLGVAAALGARDLEKVLAYAEFVKARRVAARWAHCGDAGSMINGATPHATKLGESTSPDEGRQP